MVGWTYKSNRILANVALALLDRDHRRRLPLGLAVEHDLHGDARLDKGHLI